MIRRLLVLTLLIAGLLLGVTSTAGAAGKPAGQTCQTIDQTWSRCQVATFTGGALAPGGKGVRNVVSMYCKTYQDPWQRLWSRKTYWGCGSSTTSNPVLTWR